MKNKTTKILLVSIIMIIVGLVITFASYFSGATVSISQARFGPFSIIRWDKEGSASYGNVETFQAKSQVKKVIVDVDMGDVTMIRGNEFSIRCENIPSGLIRTSETNETYNFSLKHGDFQFPFHSDYEIIVTIPDSVEVIDANLNLGTLEINDIALKQLNVDVDAGDVDIENTLASYISLKLNLGDLDFEGDASERFVVKNSAGDVDLQLRKPEINYNFDLKVDLGNLEVDDKDMGNLNASYQRSNNQNVVIEAKVNLGDLNLSFGYDD